MTEGRGRWSADQKPEIIPPFSGSRMGYAVAFSTRTFSSLAGFLDGLALNGSLKVAQFGVWLKAKLSLLIIKTDRPFPSCP